MVQKPKIIRSLKRKVQTPRDPKKESIFKQLVACMESAGYAVRREKLKQGHGFKVISGSCRLDEQRYVFVDQRLSQDDQISFVAARIQSLKLCLPQEVLASLPEKLAAQLYCPPMNLPGL